MSFLHLVLYASFVSSLCLFIVIKSQNKLQLLTTYSKKEYIHSALLGFLNPFLYYIVLFKAYSLLPAQIAQPLNWTWPVMLILLSIPLLNQKIKPKSICAIGISFIGVFIISTHGNIRDVHLTSPAGIILALSSSVIWALYWIYNVKDKRDEIVALFLNFTFGFISNIHKDKLVGDFNDMPIHKLPFFKLAQTFHIFFL